MSRRNRKESEREEYIQKFGFEKWINECKCCHRRGYRPDMPDQISVVEGSLGSYNIKKYFQPLLLDNDGYCEVCSKLVK